MLDMRNVRGKWIPPSYSLMWSAESGMGFEEKGKYGVEYNGSYTIMKIRPNLAWFRVSYKG